MTIAQLGRAFDRWRNAGEQLVLATVFETEGSTYSKAGAQMLISGEGNFQGMLSGGCLEGDLAERANAVMQSGTPQPVTYDLAQDDDELWGLGVGCDGLMRILLQPIDSQNDYQPFASMRAAYEGSSAGLAATVVRSEIEGLATGSCMVRNGATVVWTDISERFHTSIGAAADRALGENCSSLSQIAIDGQVCDVLLAVLRPLPRVLVLGAGLDAEPVIRLIAELGWRASVSDHRPAYIDNGDFHLAEDVRCCAAENVAHQLSLDHFNAAIVMSHHLVTDKIYLQQLAASNVAYVGLLGPPHRRERLLADLGNDAGNLASRLHGPAGLDIHADGPASIALSIVAQLHQKLIRQY